MQSETMFLIGKFVGVGKLDPNSGFGVPKVIQDVE